MGAVTSSDRDRGAVRTAKAVLPGPVKKAASMALRGWGMATSGQRALPDYFIIGAKRCGSTSLSRYLLRHPDVQPLFPSASHIKGAHYFDRNPQRSLAWYRSHFPRRPGGHSLPIAGDASTYYLLHPLAAERACRVAPDARIIMLCREPAQRAFSHFRDEQKLGNENRTFAAAVAADAELVRQECARMTADPHYYSFAHEHFSYVSWGHYADHLSRWLACYPEEQVLLLRSEDLFDRPRSVYRRVTDFLGLPAHDLVSADRLNAAPRAESDPLTLAQLRDHYRPHNERLLALLPSAPSWDYPRATDLPGSEAVEVVPS